MKKNNLLTVLVITYNHENYLKKCLDSILSQKTDFDFKINIVDDCSTDKSTSIAMQYQSSFPRIITATVRATNLGVEENIFLGVQAVNTKYYATIEGDDCWCDDNKLQRQVDALESTPGASFCGHNSYIIKNEVINKAMFSSKKHNIRSIYKFPKNFSKKNFVKVHPSSRVYRTASIDFANLKYKGSVVWDSSAYWYFLSKGSLVYIDQIMSHYNYTGEGLYSSADRKKRNVMAVTNIYNINRELDFVYNKLFYSLLFSKKRIRVNMFTRFILRFFPDKISLNFLLSKINS